MPGGRPRTSTKILELRGSFKKHPERKKDREEEPQAETLRTKAPPRWMTLTRAQRRYWKRIMEHAPAGVITRADLATVQAAAILWEQMDRQGDAFPMAGYTKLFQVLGQLGMMAGDRSKLRA